MKYLIHSQIISLVVSITMLAPAAFAETATNGGLDNGTDLNETTYTEEFVQGTFALDPNTLETTTDYAAAPELTDAPITTDPLPEASYAPTSSEESTSPAPSVIDILNTTDWTRYSLNDPYWDFVAMNGNGWNDTIRNSAGWTPTIENGAGWNGGISNGSSFYNTTWSHTIWNNLQALNIIIMNVALNRAGWNQDQPENDGASAIRQIWNVTGVGVGEEGPWTFSATTSNSSQGSEDTDSTNMQKPAGIALCTINPNGAVTLNNCRVLMDGDSDVSP